jgi:hypothetical protein
MSVRVEWHNERDLRTRVATERQNIAAIWDGLIRSLTDGGYLTPNESSGLPLPLRIEVQDLRKNRSSALPDIATSPQ